MISFLHKWFVTHALFIPKLKTEPRYLVLPNTVMSLRLANGLSHNNIQTHSPLTIPNYFMACVIRFTYHGMRYSIHLSWHALFDSLIMACVIRFTFYTSCVGSGNRKCITTNPRLHHSP